MNTAHRIDPLQKRTIGLVQSFSTPLLSSPYAKACLRQDVVRQAKAIREYALRNGVSVDGIVTVRFPVPGRADGKKPVFKVLFRISNAVSVDNLRGGTLLVSDAGRLGMNRAEVVSVARRLIFDKGVQIIVCDQDLRIVPCDTIETVTEVLSGRLPALAAEANAPRKKLLRRLMGDKAPLRPPGRPKGSVKHRLDGKRQEIERYLKLGRSMTDIARILGVARPSLAYFMNTRCLRGKHKEREDQA